MNIKIKRQRYPGAESYWQTFVYTGSPENTVAGVLDELNYKDDITDINGEAAPRISWECSCLQGVCGACAMVINGKPALACETFVKDCRGETMTIEPLHKFPVIADLVVDRSVIQKNLRESGSYIKQYMDPEPEEYEHQYSTARCLKCGLCLEICPNYADGSRFYGAVFAHDCYAIASKSGKDEVMTEAYDKHFAAGCSKSLSCMDVCPMKIPTLASMAKLNRGLKGGSGK